MSNPRLSPSNVPLWIINHLSLQVEIEVMEDAAIEVETGLEEVVNTAKSSEEGSDDSALALLADITSKYQHGESTLHVVKKDGMDEVSPWLLLQTLHGEMLTWPKCSCHLTRHGLCFAGSGISRGSDGCLQGTGEC